MQLGYTTCPPCFLAQQRGRASLSVWPQTQTTRWHGSRLSKILNYMHVGSVVDLETKMAARRECEQRFTGRGR
ncbi:hypothetical protein PIB30_058311 [Stylosanthes scabra]|uniref:Uncharacterized protein n=1 Tax=Stylosanthes scabra TaxID=79078 RepID=A0ABU6SK85_9FABA|nr:hypothetical protein [Stylosanthes scabra]